MSNILSGTTMAESELELFLASPHPDTPDELSSSGPAASSHHNIAEQHPTNTSGEAQPDGAAKRSQQIVAMEDILEGRSAAPEPLVMRTIFWKCCRCGYKDNSHILHATCRACRHEKRDTNPRKCLCKKYEDARPVPDKLPSFSELPPHLTPEVLRRNREDLTAISHRAFKEIANDPNWMTSAEAAWAQESKARVEEFANEAALFNANETDIFREELKAAFELRAQQEKEAKEGKMNQGSTSSMANETDIFKDELKAAFELRAKQETKAKEGKMNETSTSNIADHTEGSFELVEHEDGKDADKKDDNVGTLALDGLSLD